MTADAPGEASQGRSRLGDIPYDEWDFEALAEISPGMTPPDLSVVAFFAHHPELARKFLDPGLDPEGFDACLTTEAPSQKGT